MWFNRRADREKVFIYSLCEKKRKLKVKGELVFVDFWEEVIDRKRGDGGNFRMKNGDKRLGKKREMV